MPAPSAPDKLFESLLRVQARNHAGLPPVEKWRPPLSGDLDMRIDRDGVWYYQGGAIERQSMVKMFSNILKREGDEYFLVTPVEKWRIAVEDAPFTINEVRVVSEVSEVMSVNTESVVEASLVEKSLVNGVRGEEPGAGVGSVKDRALVATTNVDTQVVIGPANPLWVDEDAASGEPRPYVHVRGRLNGLVRRAVFYHLVDLAVRENVAGRNKLGVWSLGEFYSLGDDPGELLS